MISNVSAAGAPTNNLNAEQAAQTFFGPSSTSQTSQEFTVDQFPFSFAAYNLDSDDVITVQQIVSHGGTKLVSTYQPVFGPAQLDTNTSKLIIEHPGRYQLVHSGSSSLGTFTVLGGLYSSTSSGFAQLALALQATAKAGSVIGTAPIVVSGQGTQANPYDVTLPHVTIETGNTSGDVIIGEGASAPSIFSNVVIGNTASVNPQSAECVALGNNARVGSGNTSNHSKSIAIGWNSLAGSIGTADGSCIAIGASATVSAVGGIAIGDSSGGGTNHTGVAIGYQAANSVNGHAGVAIGTLSGNATHPTIAIGNHAGNGATGTTSFYIGDGAGLSDTHNNIMIIANGVNATANNQISLGDGTHTQLVTAGSIIQGGVISASDSRLKEFVENEQDALINLNLLNPVTFRWSVKAVAESHISINEDEFDRIQHGLIAQEVEKIFPEIVENVDRGAGEYKFVRYDRLIPVLISAIQELTTRVKELEEKENG